jgi:hypothetical protein
VYVHGIGAALRIRKFDSHLAGQEIPFCNGTRKFITVFTRTRHWILSWATWIQSTLSQHISPRSVLISSSNSCLGLRCGLLPYDIQKKIFYEILLSTLHVLPILFSLPNHPNSIWRRLPIMKLLPTLYLLALRSPFPSNSIPSQCGRSAFTLIKNNRSDISFACFNFYVCVRMYADWLADWLTDWLTN